MEADGWQVEGESSAKGERKGRDGEGDDYLGDSIGGLEREVSPSVIVRRLGCEAR